jgi:hypothetical protein
MWSGAKSNPFKRTPGDGVGFIDMPPFVDGAVLDQAGHDRLWESTRTYVGQLLGDPPEDSVTLRRAAFCLPSTLASGLFQTAAG